MGGQGAGCTKVARLAGRVSASIARIIRANMPGITAEHLGRFQADLQAALLPLPGQWDRHRVGRRRALLARRRDREAARRAVAILSGYRARQALVEETFRPKPTTWQRACWAEVQRLETQLARLRRAIEQSPGPLDREVVARILADVADA